MSLCGPGLAESMKIVIRALQQVRNMSLELRPSMLDDFGLESGAELVCARFEERTGIPDAVRRCSTRI